MSPCVNMPWILITPNTSLPALASSMTHMPPKQYPIATTLLLSTTSRLLVAVIEPENENYIFEEMHDYLLMRGFTIYPGKGAEKNTFRIANIGAIDKDDITRFLAALEDYLKSISFRD